MTTETIRDAKAWFKRYWCGRGNGDPGVILRDYLAVFVPDGEDERDEWQRQYEVDRRGYFLDLDASRAFKDKYGNDVFHLIGYLLNGAGIIEHSGSVSSSVWLSWLGKEVKESIEAGDWSGDES